MAVMPCKTRDASATPSRPIGQHVPARLKRGHGMLASAASTLITASGGLLGRGGDTLSRKNAQVIRFSLWRVSGRTSAGDKGSNGH